MSGWEEDGQENTGNDIWSWFQDTSLTDIFVTAIHFFFPFWSARKHARGILNINAPIWEMYAG